MHADVLGLIELLRRVQDEGRESDTPAHIVSEWRKDHPTVTDFTDVEFWNLELEDVDFSSLDLSGAKFGRRSYDEESPNMAGAKFQDARIDRVVFAGCELRAAVFSRNEAPRSASSVLFDCCNLVGAVFEKIELERSRFASCNLKSANFRFARLTRCELSGQVPGLGVECNAQGAEFEGATLENSLLQLDLAGANFRGSEQDKTVFDGSSLRAANFSQASLVACSLRGVAVNSRTLFQDLKSIEGCHMDQHTIACLGPDSGLSVGNRQNMIIHDDVALLRSQFSGVWMWSHVLAIVAFVIPYVWFLGHQWVVAWFHEANVETTIPLWEALGRFILRGRLDWRTGLTPHWPFFTFLLILGYNLARAVLLIKTKRLETQQQVTGIPVKFSLDDASAGLPIWKGRRIGRGWRVWRQLYNVAFWGFWVSLILIAINSIQFWMMPVPLDLTP